MKTSSKRRQLLAATAAWPLVVSAWPRGDQAMTPFTLFTFGDSILDCAHYNAAGVHPAQLLVRNNDRLFPHFEGLDLSARGPAALALRAIDVATVDGLAAHAAGLKPPQGEVAVLLTVGGNDLLRGLASDTGAGIKRFAVALNRFVRTLPLRPVLLGNVYDPTFGDDAKNFLGVDAKVARANHRRVNEVIAQVALGYGALVDLHTHFLRGEPHWFTRAIEPSLMGVSEVRAAFLQAL